MWSVYGSLDRSIRWLPRGQPVIELPVLPDRRHQLFPRRSQLFIQPPLEKLWHHVGLYHLQRFRCCRYLLACSCAQEGKEGQEGVSGFLFQITDSYLSALDEGIFTFWRFLFTSFTLNLFIPCPFPIIETYIAEYIFQHFR
jgi:hypothetical protein